MSLLQSEQSFDKAGMEQFCLALKEAREAKGLTIDSVATALRLHADTIIALESCDSANLPSKIFVMGYLRSYARFLGVDENRLEQIDLSIDHQDIDVKPHISGPSEKNSKHLSIRLVTYLVTIGMLSLLVVWWFSMQQDISDIAVVEKYPQQEQLSEKSLSFPAENGEHSEEVASEEVTSELPPVVVETAETSEVELPTVVGDVDGERAAEIDEEPVGPIAQSELTITYEQDSWTEVYDAVDNQLLYGLYKQGREVVIQGVAPFTLFFGYAPGVVVTHNEEQIEHTAFHRNGLARFKVGKAEDNYLPTTN